MLQHDFDVGVVVMRKKLDGTWADHVWLPHAALPAAPAVAPGTPLGTTGADELFYAGSAVLTLHRADTAHYRDNLRSGRPSLWIMLRLADDGSFAIAHMTADPYEGEALTEGIGGIVEAVPMPSEIQNAVAAFVEAFHIERPFIKRERDRAGRTGSHG